MSGVMGSTAAGIYRLQPDNGLIEAVHGHDLGTRSWTAGNLKCFDIQDACLGFAWPTERNISVSDYSDVLVSQECSLAAATVRRNDHFTARWSQPNSQGGLTGC